MSDIFGEINEANARKLLVLSKTFATETEMAEVARDKMGFEHYESFLLARLALAIIEEDDQ